jgi:serine/threonine protein kinase
VQVVRVDAVPLGSAAEAGSVGADLPLPPLLEPRMVLDGYRVVRQIHASHRSHVYLAVDEQGVSVALKIPAIDLRADEPALRRFMMEEWIARRIDNPNVLRAAAPRRRSALYVATEYVEGQSLAQWIIDHPRAGLQAVRPILDQVARGLQAFHRRGMLHQDLRPENILIDATGTVRIIDFGSVRVAGVAESVLLQDRILGTVQYAAPEYFLGEAGTAQSDVFALGVIAYQMLTGALPYGAAIPRTTRRSEQRRLVYRSAMLADRDVPSWVDGALAKAVSIEPGLRYREASEFVAELVRPNPDFIQGSRALYQRNPLRFWQGVASVLTVVCGVLAYRLFAGP